MASTNDVPARGGSFTAVGFLLGVIGRVFGILAFSILISVLVEWILMMFFRELPQGTPLYASAKGMFEYELAFISSYVDSFDTSDMQTQWIAKAQSYMVITINFLFIDSGAISFFYDLEKPNSHEWEITRFFKDILDLYADYFIAAIYVVMTFLVRLTILILALPIFFIFGFVGLTDGLIQRDIRRWTAATESSFVYHMAKKFAFPVLFIGMMFYLSVPYSIHPNIVLIPTAMAFALLIMVMSSKFKKYL